MTGSYDYIMVGQGIAGTLLTYCLQKRGANVFVIDKYNPSSSSNISAGIIHPITGRRKVKTWMADTLVPFAETFYEALENELKENLYHRQNVLELIDTNKDYNDWLLRSNDSEVKQYFSNEETANLYTEVLAPVKKISLARCGWLDVKGLMAAFRKTLIKDNRLLDESFNHEELKIDGAHIKYKELTARKIIFCEGWLATQNPFWKNLPFLPAKGEIVTIKSPGLKASHILSKNIFILPLGNDLYKIGSNYEWKELNETPTERIREELLTKLQSIICVPFEIVDHKAAVRPAIQDRRPVIGFHVEYANAGIFNGLGTKGVLLAPYFANHFAEHLYDGKKLNAEVNAERFF